MNVFRAACVLALALAGCGRSSIDKFDDGCPPGQHCVLPDLADAGRDGGDGGHDGGDDFGDGGRDGGDGGRDGGRDGGDGGRDGGDGGRDGGRDGGDGGRDFGDGGHDAFVPTEICDNGVDDDGNGFIDCADPVCFGNKACVVPGREICNNGIDDNDNKLIDCADPECMGSPACKPQPGPEICDNSVDDNGDGLVDCADPQCVTFPACIVAVCSPEIDFGTVPDHDGDVTRTMNTVGATRSFTTCAVPGGKARVGTFKLTSTTDVRVDFTQATGGAHVVALFRAGTNQACDQNGLGCWNVGQAATGNRTFPALSAGTYYLIVQSYPGTQASTTVRLTTAKTTMPEICNNGVDDDGNGLIDCQDLACKTAANCIAKQCNPDINVGTLIVDGPAKTATAVTTTSSNRYHPTCAGTSTGKDVTVAFTLPETAGILVEWTQTGDHVFGLFTFPAPGQACDAIQTSCFNPGGGSGGSVAFAARPGGKYVFIFKASKAGQEGTLNLRISAFKNRQQEICNNNIDDDGNGLIDCLDPACFGVLGCTAPLCVPDFDLGDFDWGTNNSVTIDTRGAQNLYKTTCSKGSGKERVVRVNLLKPMALGFSCTDTGSHVLQLSQQIQPLDPCDANNFNCADPNILPFGCNFAMPNLQPGRYNVIVDAFQQGTEGVVDLTLSGIQERILEICNNGIDDDMDGFTDCNDKKCVTSPLCTKFACRADQKIGLMPLDGSVKSVVVQTTGAGDDQKATSCVTTAGGQDAVIDFELPAKADLTLEWAQVGTHAFALYTNDNDLFACDAGTQVSCTGSTTATGTAQLLKVPAGKYHLVVDAMKPGSEGGVVVQLSGAISP